MISPTMTQNVCPDPAMLQAARRLVELFGRRAAVEAAERAVGLAKQARWPEHDVAMRVLTVVEDLLEGAP
jgi:hypothetical protein